MWNDNERWNTPLFHTSMPGSLQNSSIPIPRCTSASSWSRLVLGDARSPRVSIPPEFSLRGLSTSISTNELQFRCYLVVVNGTPGTTPGLKIRQAGIVPRTRRSESHWLDARTEHCISGFIPMSPERWRYCYLRFAMSAQQSYSITSKGRGCSEEKHQEAVAQCSYPNTNTPTGRDVLSQERVNRL